MKITKAMFSRKFFLANLVLTGVLAGFVLATLFIGARAKTGAIPKLRAENQAQSDPLVAEGLAQAEKVQSAFNFIAKQVMPSIVEIKVVEEVSPTTGDQGDWPWKFFFDNQDDQQKRQPSPRTERGLGSGVVVENRDDQYFVLTNNHVAGKAKEITVILKDKREYKASLVGKDERRDLAVIVFQTKEKNINLAKLGDSDKVQVGDWAVALGNPLGLDFSMTAGIISALQRSGGPDNNISDFIQTDAAINQGNSGGALVNVRGEVIGINTWIASPSGGSIGLGFAIPINNAKRAVRDIIDKKEVKYGWLGVRLSDSDASFLSSLGAEGRKGAFVEDVVDSSPADKSGILPGDLVIAVGDKKVAEYAELTRIVGDIEAGRTVAFSVIRDGQEKIVNVKIEERNEKVVSDNSKLWPGIYVINSDSEMLKDQEDLAKAKGVVVGSVMAKTPAAGMGLQTKDLITELNGKKIKNLREFYAALNASKGKISFRYIREGKEFETPAYIKK